MIGDLFILIDYREVLLLEILVNDDFLYCRWWLTYEFINNRIKWNEEYINIESKCI